MTRSNTKLRAIDVRPPTVPTAAAPTDSVPDTSPPPIPSQPDAPTGLTLVPAIGRSASTPMSIVYASWTKPTHVLADNYTLEWSTNSTFPDNLTARAQSPDEWETVDNLHMLTTYYFRVAAWQRGLKSLWSATVPVTTLNDIVAAGPPTAITAAFTGVGDLSTKWTNPTDDNYLYTEITIRASPGGTIYRRHYSNAGTWVYTLGMNYADAPGGVGDPVLYVEMRSVTFSGTLGTLIVVGTITKALPATPTGVTNSWSAETANNGTAGASWVLNWTNSGDAYRYRIVIDSVFRQIGGNTDQYIYNYSLNVSEHGSADPALSYILSSMDGFGQVCATPASGSVRNQNPPAPVVTITAHILTGVKIELTGKAYDFLEYEYKILRDGVVIKTIASAASELDYDMSTPGDVGLHSWAAYARQVDMFGQFSLIGISGTVVQEPFNIQVLRQGIEYLDSDGRDTIALAALFDNITNAGGVVYNP